jgi:hypothetical protein
MQPCLIGIALCLAIVSAAIGDDRTLAKHFEPLAAQITHDDSGHAIQFSCRGVERFTMDDYRALGQLTHLKKLSLTGASTLTDETIVALKDLAALEWATFDGAKLSDAGFATMAHWTALNKLTFYHLNHRGKFDGSGLIHLKDLPRFEKFACGGSTFGDPGMIACAQLPHLTDLMIWHNPVTDAGLADLPKLTKLKNLRLAAQWTPRHSDAALEIVSRIPTLETLSFGETRLTYAGGLRWLEKLPALKELELFEIEAPAADIAALREKLPGVKFQYSPVSEKYREMFERNFRAGKK